ncbi:hypothetical protein OAA99_03130, partial [Omnitrophica bacterium]|nr:hypothetical protein [Candidatus Omnitrophota bacterium]
GTQVQIAGAPVTLGEPISSLAEVPMLKKAFQIIGKDAPRLWSITRPRIYDKGKKRYRLRWARGMPVPIQLYRINEKYGLLIDETYRNNGRLHEEISENGWRDLFALHHSVCLYMALGDFVLRNGDGMDGKPAIAIEAAKAMAANVWIQQQGLDNPMGKFLGTKREPGLAPFLDGVCANGYPERFTTFYHMVCPSSRFAPSSTRRTTYATKSVRRITGHLNTLMPSLHGKCTGKDVMPLFMEINPIDGRQLAKDICDRVGREYKEYLAGAINRPRPDGEQRYPDGFRLTHPQELALFKSMRDYPDNEDVPNAIVHCHASTVKESLLKFPNKYVAREVAKLDYYDMRQIILMILAQSLEPFEPGRGTRFNTYLTENLARPKLWAEVYYGYIDRLSRHGIVPRRFGGEDDDSEVEAIEGREPNPLERLFALGRAGEVERRLAVLSSKERLFVKLYHGIRFEGDPALDWTYKDIGHLCDVTSARARQIVNEAYAKMRKARLNWNAPTPFLTDGDVYLTTQMGMSPDREFFPVFCWKTVDWLKENKRIISIMLMDGSVKKKFPSAVAQPWIAFEKELKYSAERQRQLRKRLYKYEPKPLKPKELERYKKFKRLVTDYIHGDFENGAERLKALDAVVACGSLRVPVRAVTVNRGKQGRVERRMIDLSEYRDGANWRVQVNDCNNIAYIIPSVSRKRLCIEVWNAPKSQHSIYSCNTCWDHATGKAVPLYSEYADFFLDESNNIPPPSRMMCKMPVVPPSGRQAYLETFHKDGKRHNLSINPAYAYIDDAAKGRRIFWLSAFRDIGGKGIAVHLAEDGPIVGRAYYVNGEFIPERGPLLRSRKHSLFGIDRSHGLI